MKKGTAFINIKQEVTLRDSKNRDKLNKNFSVTFNTMVKHIEELNKLDSNDFTGTVDPKYYYYKDKKYKYIYLIYNKNNGKHIIKMSSVDEYLDEYGKIIEDAENTLLKLYSFEKAQENKTKTKTIIEILLGHKENGKSNIKKKSIPLLIKLIEKYDQNGKNNFFLKSKNNCIKELTLIVKSEFSAKKTYTMLMNQLNYNENITAKKIKNYKGEDVNVNVKRFQTYIGSLNSLNIVTLKLLKSYKYIYDDNHKKIFEIYNALIKVDLNVYSNNKNTDNLYCLNIKEKSKNSNSIIKLRDDYFHNYIYYSENRYLELGAAENPEIFEQIHNSQNSLLEEFGISHDDLNVNQKIMEWDSNESEYDFNHHIRFEDENRITTIDDYTNPIIKLNNVMKNVNSLKNYYSKDEIVFMQDYMKSIVTNIQECYKSHYAYLKIDKNSSFLFGLLDLFYNYFEIKLFEKANYYKNRLTMIKKFYRNKIFNSKHYTEDYDDYLNNIKLRAQKVIEIEFLDNLMLENKKIFINIFKIDENTKSSNDIHIMMDSLENKIIENYQNNLTMMEKRLKKLDKIEYLYYLMNGIEVDINEPRRIITPSTKGIELFCKYRYENKIYTKYKYPSNIIQLTFDDFSNGFEENIPNKEYFTKRSYK